MPTKESWQKCRDESALFTAIRYHSHPFAAPPLIEINKTESKQEQLKKKVEDKFYTGNHRCASIFLRLGVIIKPLFLGLPCLFISV